MLLAEMYEDGYGLMLEETSIDKAMSKSGQGGYRKEENPIKETPEDRKIINDGLKSLSMKGFKPKEESSAKSVCDQLEVIANKVKEKNYPTMLYLAKRVSAKFPEIEGCELSGGKGGSHTMAIIS